MIVNDNFGSVWIMTAVNETDYRLTMKASEALRVRTDTLTQTINTIEKKINGLGLAESSVQQRGESQILVTLPGVDDPARIKQILQTAAMLELYEVQGGPFASREEAMQSKNGVLPLSSQILSSAVRGGSPAEFYILARTPVVRGQDLRDAKPVQNGQSGGWETSFVLTQDAAARFGRFTGAHINDRLAIVLDKKVLSAPTIQAKITDNGVITNMGGHDEAADLALNLRAGSLPASLLNMEERSVGPSLGADSIRAGPGQRYRGRDRRGRHHADLLQAQRHKRDPGFDPERADSDRRTELLRGGPDAARHRRHHPDHRYGGRLECADF